jgi:hypothetical protein
MMKYLMILLTALALTLGTTACLEEEKQAETSQQETETVPEQNATQAEEEEPERDYLPGHMELTANGKSFAADKLKKGFSASVWDHTQNQFNLNFPSLEGVLISVMLYDVDLSGPVSGTFPITGKMNENIISMSYPDATSMTGMTMLVSSDMTLELAETTEEGKAEGSFSGTAMLSRIDKETREAEEREVPVSGSFSVDQLQVTRLAAE